MDNQGAPPPEPRKGLLSGRYHEMGGDEGKQESAPAPPSRPIQPPAERAPNPSTGGLLSRYGSQQSAPLAPGPGGLRGFAQGARNLGKNLRRITDGALHRAPGHGDWRATDFAPEEIDEWDRYGDVPFELPPDPDRYADSYHAESDRFEAAQRARNPRAGRRDDGRRGSRDRRNNRGRPDNRGGWDESQWGASGAQGWNAAWDDGEDIQDIDWDNATWDDEPNGWDDSRGRGSRSGKRRGGRNDERDDWYRGDDDWGSGGQNDEAHWNVVGDLRGALDQDAISSSLNTLAELSAVSRPISRIARVRLLMRRRPAAAAMLAFCLLGFMLTCCAPLAPLVRLGMDISDLATRAQDLRALTAGGVTSVINAGNITRAQRDIASIESDLYEINGAMTVAGAPAASISHSVRDYQLLIRMGYDLTGAANESLQIAQTLVTPLEGGALSGTSATPGIQPADIQQARILLSDAYARALDAIQAYHQLDPQTLPAQLKPGTKYGGYLAQLPLVVKVFGEMKDLIDVAPALLGVGQPAYYLAIALDSSELRPGGGFQGNYGLLVLNGGKQSKTSKFALTNTYNLDEIYTKNAAPNPLPSNCMRPETQPTNLYWWWPYRCIKDFGWGLRDSNLSADFPTNARLAMQIAEVGGATPNGVPIQGVVAFTPGLIRQLLQATGNLPMPGYRDPGGPVTVTPDNLEYEIHYQQLEVQSTGDRKQFTHDLSKALLARLQTLHGSALKIIFKLATESIKSKDLQVYLADPRAELVLNQLGIASSVSTGNSDGYFVVDTNDGGNKANLYVTETQTDYVTLLPNGGAFHRLAISVTYDKKGSIFNPVGAGETKFDDYSDLQRTYLPGDATIVGWAGFNKSFGLFPDACGNGQGYATFITDCSPDHGIYTTSTNSDLAGRTMVMGALLVMCGPYVQGDYSSFVFATETQTCETAAQPHTQTIFLSWYTPNAYTVDATGHGTYTELVEKQAGDFPHLTVYVSRGTLSGAQVVSDMATFNALTAHAKKVFDNSLAQNQIISYSF
ncbi:MAG TPA: DUF4012 domain-containing protein [Ktedonobacterales bacterium]